ncbi:MAG: PocR ligand-binding domain-containing protein [Clostridia bacterium]|nr:PocR ligand-binding domain-containing protein [Clostridia bacterium]
MDTKLNTIEILKDFHKITGARISLHDLDFNEIASYPESLSVFCKRVQQTPQSRKRCVDADLKAFEKVRKTGEAYSYKCHCGLIEIVAPIYNYGILSGYVIMGQITDSKISSEQNIVEKSRQYFDGKEQLNSAVKNIPVIKQDELQSYVNILQLIAEYMTQTNRMAPKSKDLALGIRKYIGNNFDKKLTVELMCEIFGCSRTTLMNTFRDRYGITIGEYINNCRLERAEQMLLKTNESIKNIAVECGFSDQNYFSKVFIRRFGVTPTKFRKMREETAFQH